MAGEVEPAEKNEGGTSSVGQKRQRRPSVRLGDIGGHKPSVTYVMPHHPRPKAASTRPLANMVSSSNNDNSDKEEEEDAAEQEQEQQQQGLDQAVRTWLLDLGLARYAPVFEIHEVDHHVLPHLTLDDLKDMGITAVGSRRKLYAAILNLRKGLSSSF